MSLSAWPSQLSTVCCGTPRFAHSEQKKCRKVSEAVQPAVPEAPFPGRRGDPLLERLEHLRDENWYHHRGQTNPNGATEALLSFWGEPFMARTTERQVPRYIFRVQGHSDLIARFVEIERHHRFAR